MPDDKSLMTGRPVRRACGRSEASVGRPRGADRTLLALAGMAGLALALCAGCAVPQPRGKGVLTHKREPVTQRGYWLYLPEGYDRSPASSTRRYPVVVTFHGMKPFDGARAQALEWQQEADRWGYIVIAPELRTFRVFGQFPLRTVSREFKDDEVATLAILDHVLRTTRADRRYVLSTSWSSGGYMAHYMLNRHPDRFTALAVRQSNFSASVLDPDLTRKSRYYPILIVNTQNDFGICKKESRQAVEWYEAHHYKNVYWVIIKSLGHERTPDLAADFFGRVAGVQPKSPPAVLAQRQAIDGNRAGIAFLTGKHAEFAAPPAVEVATVSANAPQIKPDTRVVPLGGQPQPAPRVRRPVTTASPTAAARGARQAPLPRSLLKVRVTMAIGIQPLHIGFAAECPSDWRRTANFTWSLDGRPIGHGVSGQKTITTAGEHTLSVTVVTSKGEEYRASRTIRVLPRVDKVSSTGSP